jgi:hypothetical protein
MIVATRRKIIKDLEAHKREVSEEQRLNSERLAIEAEMLRDRERLDQRKRESKLLKEKQAAEFWAGVFAKRFANEASEDELDEEVYGWLKKKISLLAVTAISLYERKKYVSKHDGMVLAPIIVEELIGASGVDHVTSQDIHDVKAVLQEADYIVHQSGDSSYFTLKQPGEPQ